MNIPPRSIDGDWPAKLFLWVRDGLWAWLAFVTVALGVVAAFHWAEVSPACAEKIVRIGGLAFQIFGIASVAAGIAKTRRDFGHAPIWRRLREYFKRFPPPLKEAPPAITGIFGGANARMTATATLTVRPRDGATVDERIQFLEQQIDTLQNRLRDADVAIRSGLKKAEDDLAQEARVRKDGDNNLHGKLESTATGGLQISAAGVIWLLVGAVMSTASQEIACWITSGP